MVPACPARCLRWSPNVQMPAPSGTMIGAVSSAVRGVEVLFRSLLTASLRPMSLPGLGNVRTAFAYINHTDRGHARAVWLEAFFARRCQAFARCCAKSSLGLKLQGRIRNALISPVLSFDQVFGCTVLEQASRFETDGACVGMSSYVLDHGTPGGIPDASWILGVSNLRRDFRAAIGQRSHKGSTDIFFSRAWPFRWFCRRQLFGFAGNRKQHLALSLNPPAPFFRRSG